jgi:hypothetical protein
MKRSPCDEPNRVLTLEEWARRDGPTTVARADLAQQKTAM